MYNLMILGVKDKDGKLYIPRYKNNSTYELEFEEVGLNVVQTVKEVNVFPYTTPTTLSILPSGFKYAILNADVDISQKEYGRLSSSGLIYYSFKNRQIKVNNIVEKPLLYLDSKVLKSCFFGLKNWWSMYISNKDEMKIYLDLYDNIIRQDNENYYNSPSIALNFKNIYILDLILEYLVRWDQENLIDIIKINFKSLTEDSLIKREDYKKIIFILKGLNLTEDQLFIFLNFINTQDSILKELLMTLFLTEDMIIKSFDEKYTNNISEIYYFIMRNPESFEFFNADKILSIAHKNNHLDVNEEEFKMFLLEENFLNNESSYDDINYDYDYEYDYEDDYYYDYDGYNPPYNPYDDYKEVADFLIILKPYLTSESDNIINSLPKDFLNYYLD